MGKKAHSHVLFRDHGPQWNHAPDRAEPAPKRRPPSREGWWLLLIDQEPLRRAATDACRRTMKDLEKARKEWTRFTDEDQPAYARWLSATFGTLLTESRVLRETLRHKLGLIEEIEAEHYSRGGSRKRAFDNVMRRRESPLPSAASEEEPEPETQREMPEPDLDEDAKKALFDEFVRATFGINPRSLSKEEYETLRAEFDAAMFGREDEEEPDMSPPPSRAHTPMSARIKEKYRWLVRHLHPDTRKEKRPDLVAIWHEVQKAYAESDLDRLETLVALVELREGLLGAQTSLFQARAALDEMKNALRALTRSLKEARAGFIWKFSRTGDRQREILRARIGAEMLREIDNLKLELVKLEKTLAIWAQPAAERPRGPERQRGRMASRARDSYRGRAQGRFHFE
jgi:hypothetical protein